MKVLLRLIMLTLICARLHATTEDDLLFAVKQSNLDGVRKALSATPKPNVNAPNKNDKDKQTPLMLAIIPEKNNIDIVNALINANVDINAKDTNGATALMRAATYGQVDIVNVLIKAHADVDIKRNDGQTALMLTIDKAIKPNEGVIDALIGAHPTLKSQYDELIAATKKALEKGYTQIANKIAKAKEKDGGCTLLITAIDKEDIPAIETLAKAGADVNASCVITPASLAASKNNPKIISALGAR